MIQEDRKKEMEKQELNILINKGVSIEVPRKIYKRKPGLIGILGFRVEIEEKLKFEIHEPTLATLDRLSAEQIELELDENIFESDNALNIAKKLTADHSRRMAKILAIAVLGNDYVKTIQKGSVVKYKYRDKKLNELTDIFFHNIKPSRLAKYVLTINTMSNLPDFINSIRLMSANRTTMPILIEENKEV